MVKKRKAVKSKAVEVTAESGIFDANSVKEMVEQINDEVGDGTELRLVEITELFTVSPGVLMMGLSADQYRRRKNRLTRVGGEGDHSDQSVYKSDESLQFKAGERLMIEYNLIHKSHRDKLTLVD